MGDMRRLPGGRTGRRYECRWQRTVWVVWDWARDMSLGEYDHGYPAHRGACMRFARDLEVGKK